MRGGGGERESRREEKNLNGDEQKELRKIKREKKTVKKDFYSHFHF